MANSDVGSPAVTFPGLLLLLEAECWEEATMALLFVCLLCIAFVDLIFYDLRQQSKLQVSSFDT